MNRDVVIQSLKDDLMQIDRHLDGAKAEIADAFRTSDIDGIEESLWGIKTRLDWAAKQSYQMLISISCERHHNDTE